MSLLFFGLGALGSAVFEVTLGHVPTGFFTLVAAGGLVAIVVAMMNRDALERLFRYSGRDAGD